MRFHLLLAAILATVSAVVAPMVARAETFTCTSVDGEIAIEIPDATLHLENADARWVEARSMRLQDPTVGAARRHIAEFRAEEGLFEASASALVGHVDVANPRFAKPGKAVGGTTLGALRTVTLEIDLSYREQAPGGALYSGHATYLKRNGQELREDFECIAR